MLDINLLRRDLDAVVARLQARKPQPFLDVDALPHAGGRAQAHQTRTEELQAQRNALSKQVGQLQGQGPDADAVMAEVAGIADELKAGAESLERCRASRS